MSKQIDMVGRTFGELTVLEETDERKRSQKVYRCRCSCGKEVFATGSALRNGSKKSCGHLWRYDLDSMVGQIFGELTVLEVTDETRHGEKLLRCRCSCGKEVLAVGSDLRRGNKGSCGHLRWYDLDGMVGQTFGELTVLEVTDEMYHGEKLLRCRCSCGKEMLAVGSALRNGNKRSCGHLKQIDPEDILGQTFGKLTVLSVAGKNSYGAWTYLCRCSCGARTVVNRTCLKNGTTKSCGHLVRSTFDPQEIVGQQFGKWTVLNFVGHAGNRWIFHCRCVCGHENDVPIGSLKRGLSKSCGHCTEPWVEDMGGYYRYHCTTGNTFLFSPEDLDLINSRTWTMNHDGYATTSEENGQRLIRLIMEPQDGEYVDHINMDTTDNRRENLRICSWSDNNCNKVLQSNNTSGFKGVSFHKGAKKYVASLWKDGIHHYGGHHDTPEEAALAYDELAREYHGEYARLNFPREGERGCREAV